MDATHLETVDRDVRVAIHSIKGSFIGPGTPYHAQ